MPDASPEQQAAYAEATQVSGEVMRHVAPWVTSSMVYGPWVIVIAGLLWMKYTDFDLVVAGRGVLRAVQPSWRVAAPAPGQVRNIAVAEGAAVHQGDLLFTIEPHQPVIAPTDGQVDLLLHAGDSVKAGDVVVSLLPLHGPLVLEVLVPNSSMGQIRIGQAAKVLVDAYPQQDFGSINATVSWIAPTAEPSPESGYPFRVGLTLEGTSLGARELQQGLAATAAAWEPTTPCSAS
jgi:multidrug resistance efflux pump